MSSDPEQSWRADESATAADWSRELRDELEPGADARLRRRLLFAASGLATALCITFWLIGATKDIGSTERVIVPTLTLLFGAVMLLTWRGHLRYAELALLSVGGGVLIERLHFTQGIGRIAAIPVADAYELMIWFPCVYVFAYLLLGLRPALLFNLGLLAASMAVLRNWLIPGAGEFYHPDLTEFYVGQFGAIIVLYAFAHLKDRFLATHRMAVDLRSFAETDFLTGIANRRAVTQGLERELERAARDGSPLAVVLLDLDLFKRINDTHGHDEGDRALRRVSMLIDRNRRQTDVFGRWGGEEFLLITPGLGLQHAVEAADRLRRLIETSGGPRCIQVTASFGVSEYRPGDGIATLVKRADEGLMRAKRAGRNRVHPEAA